MRFVTLNAVNNSLYFIAGLLVLLWAIVSFGFNSSRYVDVLLPIAIFIVLLRVMFAKKTSKK